MLMAILTITNTLFCYVFKKIGSVVHCLKGNRNIIHLFPLPTFLCRVEEALVPISSGY